MRMATVYDRYRCLQMRFHQIYRSNKSGLMFNPSETRDLNPQAFNRESNQALLTPILFRIGHDS
jgi:hypothetical protein